jgi:HEAT repeat protein
MAESSGRRAWIAALVVSALAVLWFIYSQSREPVPTKEDQARADEIRAESRASRNDNDQDRTARLDAQVERAVKLLQSNSPMNQCEGALQLGRIGTGQQIKPLTDIVYNYSELSSVRICAVSALREMGETDTALGIYESWARGSEADLHRAAISVFGEIGPSATSTALPYLEQALGSAFMDMRYLVVESLGKLGPEADALLAQAIEDEDPTVRARATTLLKSRQKR